MKKLRALVALTLVCTLALSGCSLVDTVVELLDSKVQDQHNQNNPTRHPRRTPSPIRSPSPRRIPLPWIPIPRRIPLP